MAAPTENKDNVMEAKASGRNRCVMPEAYLAGDAAPVDAQAQLPVPVLPAVEAARPVLH